MAYLLCRTISFSIKANYLLGLERARGDVCISLWEKMHIGFPFPSNLCPRVLGFRKYWIGTWVQHSNRLLDPHSVLTTLPIWTHSICLHVVSIPPPFCHVANASASTQPVQHSYRWIKNSPFEHLTLNLCPHIWHFKHDPSKPGFCSHYHPDHGHTLLYTQLHIIIGSGLGSTISCLCCTTLDYPVCSHLKSFFNACQFQTKLFTSRVHNYN